MGFQKACAAVSNATKEMGYLGDLGVKFAEGRDRAPGVVESEAEDLESVDMGNWRTFNMNLGEEALGRRAAFVGDNHER